MTETELLSQLNDTIKLLISSPYDFMLAQSVKGSVRINMGNRVINLAKNIINFKGTYALITKAGLESCINSINKIINYRALYYIAVLPKSYGYKALVYDCGKIVDEVKIKFIFSRSAILCYSTLLYRIITTR